MTPGRTACPVLAAVLLLAFSRNGVAFGTGALLRTESPRSLALGGSGTALEFDPSLVLLNPAAAARVPRRSLAMAGRTGWLGGVSGSLIGVQPVGTGAASTGVVYANAGQVTLNASDGTSRQVTAGSDLAAFAGFSGLVSPRLALGATALAYRSVLADEVATSGVLVDVGAQFQVSSHLKTGASVRRLGMGPRYADERLAPPGSVRAGLTYGLPLVDLVPDVFGPGDLLVAVGDLEHRVTDGVNVLHAGAEYWWHGLVIVRGGGRKATRDALGNLTAGAGVRATLGEAWPVRELRIDVAIRFLNEGFDAPRQFSLTMMF